MEALKPLFGISSIPLDGLTSIQKKVEFIKQETYAGLVLYNFCEAITSHIVVQNKHRKHTYQLHFSSARRTEDKPSSGVKHPSVG